MIIKSIVNGLIKSLNQSQITILAADGLIKRYWKKNTRQHNSKFKSRFYILGFDKCYKGIENFFQISAVRTGVRAYMDATPQCKFNSKRSGIMPMKTIILL